MNVLRSNGEGAMRAHVVAAVPRVPAEPVIEVDRVLLRAPRPTSAMPRVPTGSRNPEQRTSPPPKPPGIDLPDARPATEAQRIIIDPGLVARWRAEASAGADLEESV